MSQVGKLFNRGLISEEERYKKTIDIWQATTDKVSKALADNLPKDNEIYMMADSGARGSMNQIKQLAGMRGLLPTPPATPSRCPSAPTTVKV